MGRWIFVAVLVAYLSLVGWSISARAADTVRTVTVLHETPGVTVEGEVRSLGIVQLEPVESGAVGGVWWYSLAVLADVGPTYEIRVRAREGERVSPWTEWRTMVGPVPDACLGPEDDGAIGLDDLSWVLGRLNQPGRVCIR